MPAFFEKVKCPNCSEKFGKNMISRHIAWCKKLKWRKCKKCKEEFRPSYPEQLTCSYACSNSYFRSGKNNPNWKKSKYRTTCFLYHKKKCVCCSEKNVVTVHHHDENKKNNDPRNLVPLCPTHHHYVHSRYKHLVIDEINDYIKKFKKKFHYQRL
jgi:hypothetical protein